MTAYVYHLVHSDSLPSILEAGGLYCKSRLPPEAQRVDLSHYDLQERRKRTLVTCYPGGILHDYVPFYFAPRSPMLYAIYRNNVNNYNGGQTPLIYLVSTVERVEKAELSFVFSDGHPIMRLSEFYSDQADLAHVDWEVMESILWFDDEEHPDRKRRRQAEFLVHEFFPWNEVELIVTRNRIIQTKVQDMLSELEPKFTKAIVAKSNWYF